MDNKQHILIINQLFDLERKLQRVENSRYFQRNIDRMKTALKELGYSWHNPLNEAYDDTRTDCEATISGDSSNHLHITEVIKPIIFQTEMGINSIIQRGVVIVEGK